MFLNIQLLGKPILVIESKQDWVKKVPNYLPEKRKAEVRIWVDKFGAVAAIGEDFHVAEEAETYPITVYSLTRIAEMVANH